MASYYKAPGPNEITYDDFKMIMDGDCLNILLQNYNKALKEGVFQKSSGSMKLLAKKADWAGELQNTRPITLLQAEKTCLKR